MKKILFFLLILSFHNLFAQGRDKTAPFSKFQTGFYGGINYNDISAIGGSFFIEEKTNLASNFDLKFSLGYTKSYLLESSTFKTYSIFTIDTTIFYNARTINYDKKGYDVVPISLGFQYTFKLKNLSPYLLIDAGYNLMSVKLFRSSSTSMGYLSFEEIPDEFKTTQAEVLPDNSTSFSFGAGIIYPISENLNLDLRYFYKIDSEIINTQNIVLGITF
jgi:opacity protein-like surface antigen